MAVSLPPDRIDQDQEAFDIFFVLHRKWIFGKELLETVWNVIIQPYHDPNDSEKVELKPMQFQLVKHKNNRRCLQLVHEKMKNPPDHYKQIMHIGNCEKLIPNYTSGDAITDAVLTIAKDYLEDLAWTCYDELTRKNMWFSWKWTARLWTGTLNCQEFAKLFATKHHCNWPEGMKTLCEYCPVIGRPIIFFTCEIECIFGK